MAASVSSRDFIVSRQYKSMKAENRTCRTTVSEVAIWLLDKQTIAILVLITPIGEMVFREARVIDTRGVIVKRTGLPDQVERDIGERDILLVHRRMTAPFREPVPENKRVVGAPEHEI